MTVKFLLCVLCSLVLVTLVGCSSPNSHKRSSGPTAAYNSGKSEQVIKIARSMIGVPYRYGGRSPKAGFDCSGLVYFSFLQVGTTLPRTSQAQYSASRPVSKASLRRGDLLFFRVDRRKISHVGIYLGKNRFVHAPSSGKKVSIGKLDSPYWRQRFARGGRFAFK